MRAGRVCLNVREIQIQRHQDSILRPTPAGNRLVVQAGKIFVCDRIGGEARILQDPVSLGRQALVYLKFHAVSSAGKSMEPSRTNSAA